MIIATYITYNDEDVLEASLLSVSNYVDKIVAVDGKFKDFPTDDFYSTDKTIDILKKYKAEIVIAPNLSEVEKRNIYLGYINPGDLVLNLDTDEVLLGNFKILDNEFDIANIYLQQYGDSNGTRRANRYFRFREGLHYYGRHSLLLDKDKKVFADLKYCGKDYKEQKINDFYIQNRAFFRTQERKKLKNIYYAKLIKDENKFDREFFRK